MSEEMPSMITVMKTATYSTSDVIDCLVADHYGEEGYEPGFDDVMELIEKWAADDLSCGWGHLASIKELIFINADTGEEL